ncbi:hypothetical protein [Streptomyces sp. NBC_00280]|uniref:hypothetical protein n=1 Tax=Streptomyces sp. NBC_00280 TaxID=2975699 RepID=UPI002F90D3DF
MMASPGVGTHPDLPTTLVHFTGRPRRAEDPPPAFARGSAEDRMVRILHSGVLRGNTDYWADLPVVCFSEATEAARRVILRDGVQRGLYQPWGLVFDREALIDAGARPVLYLSDEEMKLTRSLPPNLRNRRVRYEPGRSDWLHEREWRLCFAEDETPELAVTRRVVVGVIVGRRGWLPPVRRQVLLDRVSRTETVHADGDIRPISGLVTHVRVTHTKYAGAADHLARWWWNGDDLVPDGTFDISNQRLEDGLRD